MDLSAFDTTAAAEEGAVMKVRSPATGEIITHEDGRPFTIKLLGKDSMKVVNLARQQADRRIQHVNRMKTPIPLAAIEKDSIELLVAATVEWDVMLDGKKPENNPNVYRAAYMKYPWLVEQVDAFIGTRANFTKA